MAVATNTSPWLKHYVEAALTLGTSGDSGIKDSWKFSLDAFKTAMDRLVKSMEHGKAPMEMTDAWSKMLGTSAEKIKSRSHQEIGYPDQGVRLVHMLVRGIFESEAFQELLNIELHPKQVSFCTNQFMGRYLARELQAQGCSEEMKQALLENREFLENGARLFLRAVDPQLWNGYYGTVATMGDLFNKLTPERIEMNERLNTYLKNGTLEKAICEAGMKDLAEGISRKALEEKYKEHPCVGLFLQFFDHLEKAGEHRATYLRNQHYAHHLVRNFLDTRIPRS